MSRKTVETQRADPETTASVRIRREPGTRSRLSIHTVFIPRENIFFLREWLAYHTEIGVEHFYLYDNGGSTSPRGNGHAVAVDGMNKYGFDIRSISAHLTDGDIARELDNIVSDFPGAVTLVRWTPRDEQGRIVNGQIAASRHCVETFGSETDWLCLIDLDEFVFSPNGEPVAQILGEMDAAGVTRLVLYQKKFLDRFLGCAPGMPPYVLEIEECIEGADTRKWAPKNIVRADAMREFGSAHDPPVHYGSTYREENGERLRFNHYNVNQFQLGWMKAFYGSGENPKINGRDTGMRRFREVIRKKCPPSKQIPPGVGASAWPPVAASHHSRGKADGPDWLEGKSNRRVLAACLSGAEESLLEIVPSELSPEILDLLPVVAHRLPVSLRPAVSRQKLRTLAKNTVILESALDAAARLEADGIAVAFLKGAALLHLAYQGRLDDRPMGDVDLLIRPNDAKRSLRQMRNAGWKLSSNAAMVDIDMRFSHGLHLFTEGGSLDLHHRPLPEGDLWQDGGGMLDRAEPNTILGRTCRIVTPTDLFVHTCIHGLGSLAHRPGPRWLVDAGRLMARHEIDWDAAARRTRDVGLSFLLGRALRWLGRVGVEVPASALKEFPVAPRTARERAVEVWRDGGANRQGPVHWIRRAGAIAHCTQPPAQPRLHLARALRLAPSYAQYVLGCPSISGLPRAFAKRRRTRSKRRRRRDTAAAATVRETRP